MEKLKLPVDIQFDLRTEGGRSKHGVKLDDLACAWLTFQLAGKEAPSWQVADRLKAACHAGIIVPSFVPGATAANSNLVLWKWGSKRPHRVQVYDPSGRLPKNQLSWHKAVSTFSGLRGKAPSPRRGEGWGEGAPSR